MIRKGLLSSELQNFIAFRDALEKMFGDFDIEVERKLEKL
jgi:hypothetical protein